MLLALTETMIDATTEHSQQQQAQAVDPVHKLKRLLLSPQLCPYPSR
jgi:hypothetical protein